MNVYDEIRDSMAEMPDIMKTSPDDILEGLEMGLNLAKMIGDIYGLSMQRTFFIRLAAVAVQGVEVMDALLEDAKDTE